MVKESICYFAEEKGIQSCEKCYARLACEKEIEQKVYKE